MNNLDALTTSAAVRRPRTDGRPWRHVPELWHFAAEYLVLLPVGVTVALVWANIAPESYFRTAFALDFFVTDVAMVLFFGLIAKEVVEATGRGGVLHPWRRAALPVVTSVFVAGVPVVMLVALAPLFGEPHVVQGWPTTFAIDLAVGYFVMMAIFGRHPVVPLFLLLALASNALGFLVLAPAATASQWQPLTLLGMMSLAVAVAFALRRRQTRSVWPYLAFAGGLSWLALLLGGVHPALALVPIVPFLPRGSDDPGFLVDAPTESHDTLNQFERWCRHPAQVALLLFGFVTGGVPLRALDAGTWVMPLAVVAGKPAGLLVGVAVARILGLHLPLHVRWRELTVLACVSTVGFTMALFFATVAIGPGAVLSELRMGALMTLAGGAAAAGVAWLLRSGRFGRIPGR
jgi:Na+:H+ antiporter, NhaA family